MAEPVTGAGERLAVERAATAERLARLRNDFGAMVAASRDSNADDEHDPEGATIAFERSQVGALIRQAETRLEEIDGALAAVAAGTYGECSECGRRIPDERLAARPSATRCVACASR